MLPNHKKARIRQLLKDIKMVCFEYKDEIEFHKPLFSAVYELVQKLEHIKEHEDEWQGSYCIPKTIYFSKNNQEV